jgi:phosphoesterase RecJ-like protein
MISLRSDGTVDVSEIAKKYGGGGHIKAAGFVLDIGASLPWKELNE